MVKKLLLLFNYLLFVAVIQAAPVGRSDAQKKAQQFVAGKLAAARGTSQTQADLSLVKEEGSCYYIFNVGSRDGFVIVSGDDRAPEILGYSDTGSFDENNMPDNMKAWLQGYADQIQLLSDMPEVAESRAAKPKKTAKSAVGPLLSTTWGQDEPYNLKVPAFVNNSPSVTGCVATAMAQVLYYTASNSINFRGETTRAIPAYTCGRGWNMGDSSDPHHVQVPEVPVTALDWANLLQSYSGEATDAQKNAVADLMLCCGASVEMDYADQARGGSSASLASIPHALKTYFGFDNSVQYRNRSLFTTVEWEDMIYMELANNRPVLYGGQSSGGGHAFVCDGYDGDGYYHINWGWKGKDNGFFLLDALNPYDTSGAGASSSYDGYSMQQDAIIGLQAPSDITTQDEVRMTVNSFAYDFESNSTTTYHKNNVSFNYTLKCTNNLSDPYEVTLIISIYDSNNNYVRDFMSIDIDGAWKSGVWQNQNGSATGMNLSDLNDGTYKFKLRSKQKYAENIYECIDADKYYIQGVVDGTQITFSNVAPTVNLTASDFALTTDGIVNSVQTVTAHVTNNGDAYHGSVYLFVGGTKVSGNGLSVEPGAVTTAYFSFLPTTTGEKAVKITTDEAGQNVIGSGNITIINAAASEEIAFNDKVYANVNVSSLTNVNMNTYTVTDNIEKNIMVKAYCKNTNLSFSFVNSTASAVSNVIVVVAKYNESTSQYENPNGCFGVWESLSANTAYTEVTLNGVASEFGKYEIRLYKNSSTASENLLDNHFHFELAPGYAARNGNGEIVMVDAESTEPTITESVLSAEIDASLFTDVHPNSNPNTLYIITNGGVPTSLSGKNVIVGTAASNISLVDGSDFATPIDFTAGEISYSRTITKGTDGTGNGWTTIVLPFDVVDVCVGDKKIDWFHNSSDTGKDFWLRKFVSDGAGTVSFDYTDRIEANVPYIMAVPGDHWGSAFNLTGKEIVFKAKIAQVKSGIKSVVTGNNYKLYGSTKTESVTGAYILNDTGDGAGNSFKWTTNASSVAPFRAYFKPITQNSATSLRIVSPDNQTSAVDLLPAEIQIPTIYTLDGRRVSGNYLQKGIYIVNGKKVIK